MTNRPIIPLEPPYTQEEYDAALKRINEISRKPEHVSRLVKWLQAVGRIKEEAV